MSECFQVNVHSPQGLTCLCVCALVFRATSLAPFQISLLFLYYLLYNACHKLHYTKLEFELFNSYMFYKEIKRGEKLILIHLYIYPDQGHLYDLSDQGKIKMFYPGVQKVETSFYHNFSFLHCHGVFISYLMVFSFWRGNIHRVNTDSYRCPASVCRAQTPEPELPYYLKPGQHWGWRIAVVPVWMGKQTAELPSWNGVRDGTLRELSTQHILHCPIGLNGRQLQAKIITNFKVVTTEH